MRYKILYLLKVPPPFTGATLMNSYVLKSRLLREKFSVDEVCVSYTISRNDFGKYSNRKIIVIINTIKNIIIKLINNKPAIVYFQISPVGFAFIRDFIYCVIIKLFSIHIVYHIRGKGIKYYSDNNIIMKYLYKYAFNNASIICHSDIVANDFKVVYEGKPYIVENGIEQIIDDITNKNNKIPNILYISTYRKSKGLFDLISAAEVIKNKGILFKLKLIGEPTEEVTIDKLKETIRNRNLEDIIEVLGPKYNGEKYSILKSSDIFVFPTLFEAFGNVVLEAFQAGLPVVASDEGSLPRMIDDGVDGFIYKKGDVNKLAEKIEILIHNKELRCIMGRNGREKYLNRYTLERFEERLCNTLLTIIKKLKNASTHPTT